MVAWSPIMATQGSPGKMRMAKNTRLMAPSNMGTATSKRRITYCNMSIYMGGLARAPHAPRARRAPAQPGHSSVHGSASLVQDLQ